MSTHPARHMIKWADRHKEQGANGRGEHGEDDDAREGAPIAKQVQKREQRERDVALKLERDGPELRSDEAWIRIVLEHAGQGHVNIRDDVEEETAELGTGEISPQRQRRE